MKVSLVACGRLENRYAVEWVEYYKQLGFDHIYIADNNRKGEEHFEDVLQSYIDDQFVTIYNYRDVEDQIQYIAYLDIYYKISNDYDWVAFFDFDEYLTLVEDNNIKNYLSRDCFKEANQILINWKTYTDNDLVYDDGRPCLERFTTPMEKNKIIECIGIKQNEIVKTIIRTKLNNIQLNTVHLFDSELLKQTTYNNIGNKINELKYWQPINWDLSYIKHFTTKTIEEWIKNKQIRGTGARSISMFKSTYSFFLFFKYNKMTKEKHEYIKNIKQQIIRNK